MIGVCTRCGNKRKTMPFMEVRPGGHTWASNFDADILPPKMESVCGDCLTDTEIERLLGPVVAHVLGVVVKRLAESKQFEWIPALEGVRCMYMVMNDGGDRRGRYAAIRALGLVEE